MFEAKILVDDIRPLQQLSVQYYLIFPANPFIRKVCCSAANSHTVTSISVVVSAIYLLIASFSCIQVIGDKFIMKLFVVIGCIKSSKLDFWSREFNCNYHVAGNFDSNLRKYLVLRHMTNVFAVGMNIIQDTFVAF